MDEADHQGPDGERPCQAVSPSGELCGFPATVRCVKCDKWFCEAHAEDELWHPCALLHGFN